VDSRLEVGGHDTHSILTRLSGCIVKVVFVMIARGWMSDFSVLDVLQSVAEGETVLCGCN
jgi:hypothetical protein